MKRTWVYVLMAICWSTGSRAYPHTRVLQVGFPIQIAAARTSALKCGFLKAYMRPFRDGDIPTQHPDRRWMTLDAAVDVSTRSRELECFLNNVIRPGLKNFRE